MPLLRDERWSPTESEHAPPYGKMRHIAALRPLVALVIVVVGTMIGVRNIIENEGRSGEARATVVRYLEALRGAEDDRGWALLSASMREGSGSRDEYIALASSANARLATDHVRLTYEDDGFYVFTVTASTEIADGYAEALFEARGRNSPIACRSGPTRFEIGVGIGFFSPFAGVSGNACP
jgi:hypothetical protein